MTSNDFDSRRAYGGVVWGPVRNHKFSVGFRFRFYRDGLNMFVNCYTFHPYMGPIKACRVAPKCMETLKPKV